MSSSDKSLHSLLSQILHAFRDIGQRQLTLVTCGTGLSINTLFWVQSSGSGMKDNSTTFEVSSPTLLTLPCLSVVFELKDWQMFDSFFLLSTNTSTLNSQVGPPRSRSIHTFPEFGIVCMTSSQSWLWTNFSRRRQSRCPSKHLWVAIAQL